jgi:hypothetical protein
MIQFTSKVSAILANPSLDAFYVVDIGNGLYRTTSYYADVVLSDNRTFFADGHLAGVDSPQLTSTVDREIYKIAIADPDFYNGELIEDDLVGKPAEVRLVLIDPVTGQPELNIVDTILVYEGLIEGAAYTIDTATIGTVGLSITCSSPMADLDLRKPVFLSKDYMRGVDPTDSTCDQIYEGSGQIKLKWGKQ